jgi:hypothetical protein
VIPLPLAVSMTVALMVMTLAVVLCSSLYREKPKER